ncbi:hypothetical protein VI06_14335 [Aquitalea magnusonii]|nr:hypothetical protein VI06_14335 [Aquitalea magnusonii]
MHKTPQLRTGVRWFIALKSYRSTLSHAIGCKHDSGHEQDAFFRKQLGAASKASPSIMETKQ